jgi:hypothetical protein
VQIARIAWVGLSSVVQNDAQQRVLDREGSPIGVMSPSRRCEPPFSSLDARRRHMECYRHCLCVGKGVCFFCAAFLSTAAPRRGILPDLEQQPSPKRFL